MHPIYQLRIRKLLFEEGLLSAKGLLNNEDILILPGIAKRTPAGTIALHEGVFKELSRYSLVEKLAKEGNMFLSILLEYNDQMFAPILEVLEQQKESGNETDLFSTEKVKEATNTAYINITDILLDHAVSELIHSDIALTTERDKLFLKEKP